MQALRCRFLKRDYPGSAPFVKSDTYAGTHPAVPVAMNANTAVVVAELMARAEESLRAAQERRDGAGVAQARALLARLELEAMRLLSQPSAVH